LFSSLKNKRENRPTKKIHWENHEIKLKALYLVELIIPITSLKKLLYADNLSILDD